MLVTSVEYLPGANILLAQILPIFRKVEAFLYLESAFKKKKKSLLLHVGWTFLFDFLCTQSVKEQRSNVQVLWIQVLFVNSLAQ